MNASLLITLSGIVWMSATLPGAALAADNDTGLRSGAQPAATPVREMGEHPAVLVFRNWDKRGYDYASQFYLHPARLALESVPPREMQEHPAVTVARTWNGRSLDAASQIAVYPAQQNTTATPAEEPGGIRDRAADVVPMAAAAKAPGSRPGR